MYISPAIRAAPLQLKYKWSARKTETSTGVGNSDVARASLKPRKPPNNSQCILSGDGRQGRITLAFARLKLRDTLLINQANARYEPYTPLCRGENASSSDLEECYQALRDYNPLFRGLYADQLERWFRVFDRSRVSNTFPHHS